MCAPKVAPSPSCLPKGVGGNKASSETSIITILVVVETHATCLMKSDRSPQNSSQLRARIFTLVVSLSFEHHAGGSMILVGSTLFYREKTLGVARGLQPLFPFLQPHERTCGSTAI
ncbi:hypothetical protein TNCV_3209451 [Trichonephila clavipes]|nr:hypothetical protein TNCV_3209451 [Trichonephila clavipes]